MDLLHINAIRAYGYVGVLPEEQTLGQWYEVSLALGLDLSQAGKTDRLEETYDYRAIVKAVQELIQTARFKLIEKLAAEIAQLVLSADGIEQVNGIDQVTVKLTKLTPPIPDFTGTVTVEITRFKSEQSEVNNRIKE